MSFSHVDVPEPNSPNFHHLERSANTGSGRPNSARTSASPIVLPAYGRRGRFPDADRHERLPAARGGRSAVRVERRGEPPGRPRGRRRAELAGVAGARRRAAVSGAPVPAEVPVAVGRLAARVRIAAGEHAAEVVLFGHGLPLGLLGPATGLPYVVATHGTEYWFSQMPGLRALLGRATAGAARVLAVSRFTGRVIRTAVPARVPVS